MCVRRGGGEEPESPMPTDPNTLGALISEVKHTMTPRGLAMPVVITDPAGYLRMSAATTSRPSSQGQARLPSEQDLATLLARLVPPPRPGSGDPNTVAGDLEGAV